MPSKAMPSYPPEFKEANRRQKRSRYVQEDGSCNVLFHHLPGEWGSYISDIFTTLVEIRWRIMLLIYSLSYVLSWLFFGVLFWLIAIIHGDMDDPNNDPCMANVRSFAGAFLFSLESQATIGYGYRCVTEECALAIILLTAQSVLSCIIDTFIIGGAVAKMASGRRRAQTIGFSDCAVICLRDGKLCLVWRIGDFRQNHMVEGTARAQLLRFQDHPRGKVSMTYHDLKLSDNEVILVTPVLIVHEIGPGSPFYGMSRRDLLQEDFELVVTFTYTGDSTGILHQTRTAFAPEDILWGHQFLNMLKVKERYYKVDYAEFNNTKEVYAPDYSAEEHNQKEQAWFIQPCIISHDTETKTSYPELKPSITSKNHENQLHKSNELRHTPTQLWLHLLGFPTVLLKSMTRKYFVSGSNTFFRCPGSTAGLVSGILVSSPWRHPRHPTGLKRRTPCPMLPCRNSRNHFYPGELPSSVPGDAVP
uniref:Inward rectifier potassium channel 16 n=1 Tax=Erpetoichthys calabaricus TaxID=27687 RepID=A0A8C4XFL0_ERPCA